MQQMFYILTSGKHALHKVLNVAQDNSISLRGAFVRSKSLDLNNLAYWNRELRLQNFRVIEDCTVAITIRAECYECGAGLPQSSLRDLC